MLRRFTKKRVVIALTVVAALAIAAGAVAYLNTTGSGSGSGTVTARSSNLALTASGSGSIQTTPISAFATLNSSQPFYIWAAQTTQPQETATVTTTVTPVATSGCPAGSFTIGTAGFDPTKTTHQTPTAVEVPAGTGQTNIGSDTVYFNDDTSADQTACEQGYTLSFATP